jgi:hypothetical protein
VFDLVFREFEGIRALDDVEVEGASKRGKRIDS